MKYPSILATLLLTLCSERASAQVYLFNGAGTSTTGAVFFNDAPSGGTFTSDFFGGFVGDQAMFIPPVTVLPPAPLINYTSGFPHVDSAIMNVDITQTPFPNLLLPTTTGIPWFAATASLTQVGPPLTGTLASLPATMIASFEGFMTGADPAAAAGAGLLNYSVSGIIGTNGGAFASLNAVLTYTETVGGAPIGTLTWNYLNSTTGPFLNDPVIPFWTPDILNLSGLLTSNLITVNGVITLQADPSSISIAPVPEPTAWVSLFLGAAALAGQRRRGK